MIQALDHIAYVVNDLEAALDGYTRLFGRAPNWRGDMHGASQVWFQLGNMALDVIAPTGEGPVGDTIRARIASHGEGIWGVGFAVPDLAQAGHRFERVGLKAWPREEITTNPDTGATRRWAVASLAPKATHGVNLFLVEQAPGAQPWPPAPVTVDEGSSVSGLDHVVIRTPNPDRAAALYGARMGLDMRLDRSNPDWGTRLMFFRVGDLVVEIAHDLKAGVGDGPDSPWGLSWRVANVEAAHHRMAGQKIEVSEIRKGRKPGTRVFTVKSVPGGAPTLVIGPDA